MEKTVVHQVPWTFCFGKIFIVDSSHALLDIYMFSCAPGYLHFILEKLLLHVLLKGKWFVLICSCASECRERATLNLIGIDTE